MLSKIVYDVKTVTGFLPKINLIGHSRGGITNLQYALDHPDMVASLISTGTPYLGGKMLENDEVLKMFNFIQSDVIPDGMKDIRDASLQNHFMKRWNDNRGKGLNLYNNINAHAFGGYSRLPFLNNIIDASGAFLDDYDPGLLKFAINYWDLINFPIVNMILTVLVNPAQKEILNTIAKSVRAEDNSFWDWTVNGPVFVRVITYYMDDDLVVDINSQLATGYSGFTQKAKLFSDTNAFSKRSDWGMPPIVHNLKPATRTL